MIQIYDETIRKIQGLLNSAGSRELPMGETDWPEVSDRSMILRSDMAYELGGEGLAAIGCTIVTQDETLVPEDAVTLTGRDLPHIREDVPYARIAVVRLAQDPLSALDIEPAALYEIVRELGYTRYHFYPKGFMMRVSASRQRESVRIGRKALGEGLDFARAGNRMIAAFHRHREVRAAHIYYVTDEAFDYKALAHCASEAERITGALDHIYQNAATDCDVCGLRKVCDEVEGLRKLHFAR